MEHLSTKELIDEVAKRHGIMLDEKDPILVTLTLNEIIIENYIKAVEASISKINARQIENAKLVGEEIITKAANYLATENAKYSHNSIQNSISSENSSENSNLKSKVKLKFKHCFAFSLGIMSLWMVQVATESRVVNLFSAFISKLKNLLFNT